MIISPRTYTLKTKKRLQYFIFRSLLPVHPTPSFSFHCASPISYLQIFLQKLNEIYHLNQDSKNLQFDK